jgi:hypothetical protein
MVVKINGMNPAFIVEICNGISLPIVLGRATRRIRSAGKMASLQSCQSKWAMGECVSTLWLTEKKVAMIHFRALLDFAFWTALAVLGYEVTMNFTLTHE